MSKLKAPFPAFGGKRRVADLVWSRIGDVANFIEPFCRSAAVLLCRPHAPGVETLNDMDQYIANFWRAIKADPEAVAFHADWPVVEADLHARHRWLLLGQESVDWREKMRTEPDHFDAKIAGWWVWGACCWIGAGWCTNPEWNQVPAMSVSMGVDGGTENMGTTGRGKMPDLSGAHGCANGRGILGQGSPPSLRGDSGAAGSGIHSSAGHKKRIKLPDGGVGTGVNGLTEKRPRMSARSERDVGTGVHKINSENRPQLGDAYSRGRGVHGNDMAGTCQARLDWVTDWFWQLADRLRVVRVCCGDWARVCSSPSVTTRLGTTGVFLDAPYKVTLADGSKNRDDDLYGNDKHQNVNELVDRVITYCLERGADPMMRIAACCLEGEGYEVLLQHGWECVPWKASGGYGNRNKENKNADRERIYFSPHCVTPRVTMNLFAGQEAV